MNEEQGLLEHMLTVGRKKKRRNDKKKKLTAKKSDCATTPCQTSLSSTDRTRKPLQAQCTQSRNDWELASRMEIRAILKAKHTCMYKQQHKQ